jgi:hypothetical protein
MEFTHSRPTKKGVSKRRECPFCHRTDRVLLRVEVLAVIEVARQCVRTNTLAKKSLGKGANQHANKRSRAGNKKHTQEK